jgi:hypothetical protein
MALTLTFNQPGIPAGDLDRGRTDILTTDAGGGRSPVVTIDIGDVPAGAVVLVQAIDEPPASSPMLTQVSDTHWTLDFNAGAWGPFRIQATASIGTEVVSSVTRRISVRSPTFHLAYPALSERYDPNAHLVPTVPSVQLTEMNEHSTNRALVDFHREVVQAIDTLSAGGIDSIPDGSITEAKLDPALVAQLVLTDGSHAMVGELDMSGSRIVDLGQPTLPTDAARLADADYTAGAGLVRTGQTLDVVAHVDGSIIVGTDSVQVGALASDAQHGTRGGGTQHATVTPSSAGFSSAADKTKLDGIAPGADVTLAALAAAAVPVSVNAQRITNLGAPIAATDAVRAQDLTAAAVVAGAGLVRAGTTLDVVAHADGSIVVAADSVQVGVLATDAQHGTRGGAALHAIVTPTVAGFSSAADKTKLDTIATGADVTIAALAAAAVPVSVNAKRITNLGTPTAATDAATKAYVDAAPPVPHASTHADGGSDELNVAGLSGLLADPQTAGGIKTATTTVAVAAAAAPAADQALMATSSTAAAWRVPPVATTSLPGYLSAADKLKLDGVATSAAAVGSTAASQVTVTTAGPGAAVTAARSDHVHSVATGAPSGLTVGGVQAAGTSTSLVRQDHVHAMPALVTTTVDGFMSAADKTRLDGMATSAAAVGSTAASQVTVATAASGAATTAARSDHVHSVATAAPSALTVGSAQNAGTSTSLVRADHVHAMPAAGTPVALTLAGANAPGSAATLALSDHVHALPATAAPAALTVGGSSSAGVAVTLPRSDHVHAMPALVTTSVDGFMSAADKSKLDGVEAGAQVTSFARVQTALAAASSAVGINAQRLTSVADPTGAQDAATKAYVDALAQGLDTKASCRLVSTTNMGTLGGAQVIDGIVTQTGDRLLIVGQTTASQNGIYIGSGINWLRAPDADTSAKVTSGMYVFVTEGAANADSGWALITPDPIVLGTTALTFTQVTGAGQITAGAGLTKSGNTLNVVAHADASIVVAADSVQVGVITDAQHGTRAGGTTHATVIAAGAAGFMSGSDKTKLDGIATGAAAVLSVTPLQVDGSSGNGGAAVTASRSDHRHQVTAGSPVALTLAGATADGTSNNLARADHVHALPATAAPAALTVGAASSAGVAVTLNRSDHVHAMPAAGTPVALTLAGANAPGSAATLALSDHVHALPASSTAPPALTVGGASAAGSSTSLSKADHVHALPASGAALENTGVATAGTSTSVARDDHRHPTAWKANAVALLESVGFDASAPPSTVDGVTISAGNIILVDGTLAPLADDEPAPLTGEIVGIFLSLGATWQFLETLDPGEIAHVRSRNSLYTWNGTQYVEVYPNANYSQRGLMSASDYTKLATIQANAAAVTSTAPTQITVTTAAAGSSGSAARGDHVHSVSTGSPVSLGIGQTAGDGTSTALARADHSHATPGSGVPGALTLAGTNSAGVATTVSRSDHVHALPASITTPTALVVGAGSATAGTSTSISRADHVHALPSAGVPTALTLAAGNSQGSAATLALSDHVHALPLSNATPSALTVNGAAAVGTSTSISKADHLHAMPGLATTGTDGFLSSTEKVLLSRFPRVNQLRLSGESGAPLMTTDNAAISTIYLVPYTGNTISLYSSALGAWLPFDVANPAGLSLALSGMTAGRPYDVFCVTPAVSGTPSLEILAWTSTSARATALAQQDGVQIKSGDATRRYVGTIYARTATTISWVRTGYNTATAQCDIWNNDNREPAIFANSTLWTGSFATASANTWFQVATSYKTELIIGRVLTPLDARFSLGCNTAGTANAGYADIWLNGSGNGAARILNTAGEILELVTQFNGLPTLGYNTLQFMALGTATAVLFYTTDDPAGTPPVYAFGCFTRHDY